MGFTIGIVGAGGFSVHFAKLWKAHPGVDGVFVTDLLPERSEQMSDEVGLQGTFTDFESMLASDQIDAVAIFTQRWTHGPLVLQALNSGKHVYSAVPMASSVTQIKEIVEAVGTTRLTYMMGETSYYNPATVLARQKLTNGEFGRVFYSEGDYVHDMDLGFYEAFEHSGGDSWRATASFPPLLYPTHSIGGVLGVLPAHAVSVSAIGMRDTRDDGVFDKTVSMFDNDFSNSSALFELSDGGVMRINEMRRVGYPSLIRESRFRYFGTDASLEQLATVTLWQNKEGVTDVSELVDTVATMPLDDPSLAAVSPALRHAFVSGLAPIHSEPSSRLPLEFRGLPNGHEGSHHFLADDFVRAVNGQAIPPVNAWAAARYTLPGLVAHESALNGGERLQIDDLGDPPTAPASW